MITLRPPVSMAELQRLLVPVLVSAYEGCDELEGMAYRARQLFRTTGHSLRAAAALLGAHVEPPPRDVGRRKPQGELTLARSCLLRGRRGSP